MSALDALRAARLERDFTLCLSLALREVPCRSEAERFELLFYRTSVFSMYAPNSPRLADLSHRLTQLSLDLIARNDHPLLAGVLSVRCGQASQVLDLDQALRAAEQAFNLMQTRRPPQIDPILYPAFLPSAAYNLLLAAHRVRQPEKGAAACQFLTEWLSSSKEGPDAMPGPFWAAAMLARFEHRARGAQSARRFSELAASLFDDPTHLVGWGPSRACSPVCGDIRRLAELTIVASRSGMLNDLPARVRSMRELVVQQHRYCACGDILQWMSLTEVALATGHPAAPILVGGAVRAFDHKLHAGPDYGEMMQDLFRDLIAFRPRRPRGELGDLLWPDAWPNWRVDGRKSDATAEPVAGIVRLS